MFGISQNVFNDVSINFTANEPTSVGLEIEGADNNTFIQLNVFGGILNVTDCTNTTPIVVTTNIAHDRTTGDNIRITPVVGNTACGGNFTITVLTPTTFELDGSAGNGAYVSAGTVCGPGHAVRFDQVESTGLPASNVFINPAFQRVLFTSLVTNGSFQCPQVMARFRLPMTPVAARSSTASGGPCWTLRRGL